MINGFVVEISSENEKVQSICLFKEDHLPEGISVVFCHTEHDYKSLAAIALKKGFIGNGINTDEELHITIHNVVTTEKLFSKFITDKKIEIDGVSKYIEVVVPPKTTIMFQLMPYFE